MVRAQRRQLMFRSQVVSWVSACHCRLVLSLRQEYLPGGVRTSQEEAKAAAVKAREVRWVGSHQG
jgi:hypothetical protein